MKRIISLFCFIAIITLLTIFIVQSAPPVFALEAPETAAVLQDELNDPITLSFVDIITSIRQNWELITAIVGLAATALGWLATKLKDGRLKRSLTKLKNAAEAALKVESEVKEYVEEAETFLGYSGSEKKRYVKTRINQFCIDNNYPYVEAAVDAAIEACVQLSKKVNARGSKSKTPTEAADALL
ncbi:MAG: hypothetical protein A2Y16_05325 [Tenericutes bacterium GWF2_57_13]|nr:MAG: hypothetical protein A2Y16_05325 [Tenericutes bacterium GWF2_57_13]